MLARVLCRWDARADAIEVLTQLLEAALARRTRPPLSPFHTIMFDIPDTLVRRLHRAAAEASAVQGDTVAASRSGWDVLVTPPQRGPRLAMLSSDFRESPTGNLLRGFVEAFARSARAKGQAWGSRAPAVLCLSTKQAAGDSIQVRGCGTTG